MEHHAKIGPQLLSVGIGALLLSLIGLYNGYPLVYSDTGTYIYSGFDMFIPVDRPLPYGLFVRFFSFKYSAWFVILFQNLLTAIVIYEAVKLFLGQRVYFRQVYFAIMLFLVFFTGIGWYSNQLMPDFFAPVTILAIFILLKRKTGSVFSTVLLGGILIYSLITHFSHLLIGTTLMAVVICGKAIFKQQLKDLGIKRILYVGGIVCSGWLILPTINYVVEKQFILSKASHVFLMAHLNDTGILEKFLNENCSKPEFKECKLCHYKDSLPVDLASFIWSGKILENTGGWIESKEEYNKIVTETLKQPDYLFLNIYRSLSYGLIQLTKNEIGQGLSPYNEGSPPYGQIHWRFRNELNTYLNSRQNKWDGANLKFDTLNTIHSALIACCLFFLVFLLTSSVLRRIEPGTLLFLLFVLIAIAVNSFITAGLNSPCERFQARVIWLLPFALMLLCIKNAGVIKSAIAKVLNLNKHA